MKTIILIIGLLSTLTAFASEPCTPEIQQTLDKARSEDEVLRAYWTATDALRRGSMYQRYKGDAITKVKSEETALLLMTTIFNEETKLLKVIWGIEAKYDCREEI